MLREWRTFFTYERISALTRISAPLIGEAVVAILIIEWDLSILYPRKPKDIFEKKLLTLLPIYQNVRKESLSE